MLFVAIIALAGAIFIHQFVLAHFFGKDPKVFFQAKPWDQALLRLSDTVFIVSSMVAWFVLAVLFGSLGVFGIVALFVITAALLVDTLWFKKLIG